MSSNFKYDSLADEYEKLSLAGLLLIRFGAKLGEYRILTPENIDEAREAMANTYEDLWIPDLVPFAELVGTGDFVLVDPRRTEKGQLAILDGFHELPPSEWDIICYGIQEWLLKMVEFDFKPYWLQEHDNDDA